MDGLDVLRRDVGAALVAMRRAPGFAATALITLGLGIGATTAVFSIVYGVLLRPLPYANPERLVRLWEEYPGGVSPAGNRWLSRGTYAGWREHARTLEALGGYTLPREYELEFGGGGDGADRIGGGEVLGTQISPAVLGSLGVTPALGRFFTDDDDREGAPRVAVLSDVLWRERCGAQAAVVGASLVVDGDSYTIVGVAPPGFAFPDPRVRVWLPFVIPRVAAAPTGPVAFTSLARLKPGVSLAQVEAEGTAFARAAPKHRLTEFFFGKGGPVVVHARPLIDDMTAPIRPALSVLAAAVALVLLIACANVTNLLLSRGVTRQRELAIRAAAGASRGRLARQMITESSVFALAGGALGLALAWWLLRLLPLIAPVTLPRVEHVRVDGAVVMLWALATLVAAVAAGGAPALRGARVDITEALRSPDGSTGSGFRGAQARRLRDGLLIVEAAFAVILIVGASLLTRSFVRLMRVDSGYTAEGVLIASVGLPRGTTAARTDQFIDATLTRLRATPGVSAAGAAAMIPLMRQTAIVGIAVPESLAGNKPTAGRALAYDVTPGYAEAIGLRLREGRFFTEADARIDTLATIVNQEFVRQHLATEQAVGVRIPNFIERNPHKDVVAEIVGVVGNVLKDGNDRQPQPEVYFLHGSHGQRIDGQVNLVIRTTPAAATAAPLTIRPFHVAVAVPTSERSRGHQPEQVELLVRQVVLQTERDAVINRIEPLSTAVAASMDAPRFATTLVGAFAVVAMVLAAIGLYGVLSYSVSQRRRELGIRAALGATRSDLVRLILREGLSVTFTGIALGILAASLFTRLMQDLLFAVTPLDAVAFTTAPAILIMASLAACLGPAWRAASTDPAATLRRQ